MKTKTLFGIFTITAALLTTAHAQVPFTNSLVAYYPFNGNANDATGNGNNLANYGATLCADRFGNPSNAYSFNGSSYLGSSTPPLSQIDNCTLTAWIQLASLTQGPGFVVCMGENAEINNGFGFGVWGGNQLYAFYPAVSFAPDDYVFMATNQWYQVVMVRSSDVATFFVNGVPTTTTFSSAVGPPTEFEIGSAGDRTQGGLDFIGSIDDIRIYNRALSTNEVQELYAYESETAPPLCTNYYPATATATVVDGFVVAATITDVGCGYTNTPLVLIQGGDGTGATGTAIVTNGVVVGITITDAGINYGNSVPTIYIYYLPSIAAQPQPAVVDAYSSASFSVTASGTPPLSYQWSFNSTNILWATNSTLTISNVVQTNLGTYAVVITNDFGTIMSSNATLSMYPHLVSPFGGLDTDWGYTNILSVQAWGSGPLSFQWYQNGVALPGATNETLDFTGIQFTNAGLYSLVVSNPFGSVTNTPEQVVVNPAGISLGLFPGVIIQGVVGYNYIIQSTTNLSNTNAWVSLTNLTLTQPIQLWIDSNTDTALPGNPQKFYQVLPGQ